MNGEADPSHRPVELHPRVAPSVVTNDWKTVTSRQLRREVGAELDRIHSKPVLWRRSDFVAPCDGAPQSVIKQYIEKQAGPD